MESWHEKRNEFMKDLHDLLKTYERFLDNPEYEDYQGDAYDFVLDDMRNIYVKWIHKCNCQHDEEF